VSAAISSHIAIMILRLFHQIELSMNSCSCFADLRKYKDPLHVDRKTPSAGDAASRRHIEVGWNFIDWEPISNRWIIVESGVRRGRTTAADLTGGGALDRS
jgi:hypothetical protein